MSEITRLITGNNASETYVFTVADSNESGSLDRRDVFTLEVFEGEDADIETAENIGKVDADGNAVEIRSAHSGGSQHYVNTSGGDLDDVRDIIGGFFNAQDAEALFNAIVAGEVSGIQDVEISTDLDGNLSLKFGLLTNKARDGNNLETADVDTIIINFGNDEALIANLNLEALPEVRPALTGTINNTNIDGAHYTVTALEDGNLAISVEANGITVTEEVGSSFLYGNPNDVGDETVTALRNPGADAPGVPDDFGFGGSISADEVEELLDGFDSKTYTGTDGDHGASFDFTLTFGSEANEAETQSVALTGVINTVNEEDATVTLTEDDGDVVLSVETEGVTATENFADQILFGNTSGSDPVVVALSEEDPVPGVPELDDVDVGGFLSADEIVELVGDEEQVAFEITNNDDIPLDLVFDIA